jgi:hypothetical protein
MKLNNLSRNNSAQIALDCKIGRQNRTCKCTFTKTFFSFIYAVLKKQKVFDIFQKISILV